MVPVAGVFRSSVTAMVLIAFQQTHQLWSSNLLVIHKAWVWIVVKQLKGQGWRSDGWMSKGGSGSFKTATSSVPSGSSLMYFGLFLACGVFFIVIAFSIFLPVMVLAPQKFAICFTMGCGFIVGSFFALKGPKNQLAHMITKERLPFTLGFLLSTVGTIYVSMVLHSYILSVFFSVLQEFGEDW